MKISFIYGIGLLVANPSISISYLAASVKASGRHHATLIDSFLQKDKKQYILDRIKAEKPDAVCFSLMSSYIHASMRIAWQIKQIYPDMKIIVGGPHAILRPEEIISDSAVDAICTCEGEIALVEYLDDLASENRKNVSGFWYRTETGIIRNEQRPPITDLDSLPFPDWSIWDHSIYRRAYMRVMASRGCPNECAYCSTKALNRKLCQDDRKNHYRIRSAANVVAEIKHNLELYGRDGFLPIIFSDSIFGLDKKQFDEFCRLAKQEGLDKTAPWRVMAVANIMTDDWVRQASDAGCFAVDMGMEHSDEEFRISELNKKITNAHYKSAMDACRKYNIAYGLFIMFGYKGESFMSNMRNIINAIRQKPLYCSIFFFIPLPDTDLWDRYNVTETPQNRHRIRTMEHVLEWAIKIINQLAILNVIRRLHGLRRTAALSFKYTKGLLKKKPGSFMDSFRLLNYQIQQYSFLPELKSKKYDNVNRDAFYKA